MNAERIISYFPKKIWRFLGLLRRQIWSKFYKAMSTEQIFSSIYKNKFWGSDKKNQFNSRQGTHDHKVLMKYVNSVRDFLGEERAFLTVLDVGCGDFFVGQKLYKDFLFYTAIDIVPQLIKFNEENFVNKKLKFVVSDVTQEKMPSADVIFIRQVLQHLSNEKIKQLISNLPNKFKYLILTEHLPSKNFIANKDIITGHETRLKKTSRVILHQKPFNFEFLELHDLCEISTHDGVIKTICYTPKILIPK